MSLFRGSQSQRAIARCGGAAGEWVAVLNGHGRNGQSGAHPAGPSGGDGACGLEPKLASSLVVYKGSTSGSPTLKGLVEKTKKESGKEQAEKQGELNLGTHSGDTHPEGLQAAERGATRSLNSTEALRWVEQLGNHL